MDKSPEFFTFLLQDYFSLIFIFSFYKPKNSVLLYQSISILAHYNTQICDYVEAIYKRHTPLSSWRSPPRLWPFGQRHRSAESFEWLMKRNGASVGIAKIQEAKDLARDTPSPSPLGRMRRLGVIKVIHFIIFRNLRSLTAPANFQGSLSHCISRAGLRASSLREIVENRWIIEGFGLLVSRRWIFVMLVDVR